MKNNILLSLIIPVYNAEKYLKECLDSVFSQSENSLEIIIINDGSTDSSQSILNQYKEKYDFILITTINQGVAACRNLGISLSSGNYIAFLDSDDVWCDGAYKEFKSIIKSNNSIDCIIFNYREIKNGNEISEKNLNITNVSYNKNNMKEKINIAKQSHWFLWRFIVKSSYYNSNFFDVDRRFEDQLTLPFLFYSAKYFALSTFHIVNYRQISTSITKNIRESDLRDSRFGINRYIEYNKHASTKLESRYWSIIISKLYLSHISKCARIYHKNPDLADAAYYNIRKKIKNSTILKSRCLKTIIYHFSFSLCYNRLISSVENEVRHD
ncbi:TPA: glycosyltransferase family 2 protein [Providencia alcalifaciens]|nr:glycosyltransferase family 2 protein [Providencia alcalifaciens]